MNKLSLTISGLTDYSPKKRAELVEYLSDTFSISPEILGMKLQSFPVTFPNWVEEEQLDQVRAELEQLGAVVELGDVVNSDSPVKNEDSTTSAKDQANEDESLSVDQSPTDALDTLSFDANSETLHNDEEEEFKPAPTVAEPAGGLSLSFDDEPAEVKLEATTPSPKKTVAKEETFDLAGLDFNDNTDKPLEPSPTTEPQAENTSADFSGLSLDSPAEEETFKVENTVEDSKPAPLYSTEEPDKFSEEQADDEIEPAEDNIPDLPTPPTTTEIPANHHSEEEFNVEIDEDELELLGYQEGPSKTTLILAGLCIVIIASLATFIFMMDYQPSDGLAVDNDVISSIVKQQQRIAEAQKKAQKKKPQGPGAERWSGELELEGIKTTVRFDTKDLVIRDIRIEISTPPPAKLTVDELVDGKAQPVWLNKFAVERLELYDAFDPSKPSETVHKISKFDLQMKGKAYMRDHGGRGRRILADINLSGELSPDGTTIRGEWRIANGEPGEAALPKNTAKYLSGVSYRLFYEGSFRAKKEEKPVEEISKSTKPNTNEKTKTKSKAKDK